MGDISSLGAVAVVLLVGIGADAWLSCNDAPAQPAQADGAKLRSGSEPQKC